jgi:hypothetical protein
MASEPGDLDLVLYGFKPSPDIGLDDISPFVVKVIAYLRLQGYQYTFLSSDQVRMRMKVTMVMMMMMVIRKSWR